MLHIDPHNPPQHPHTLKTQDFRATNIGSTWVTNFLREKSREVQQSMDLMTSYFMDQTMAQYIHAYPNQTTKVVFYTHVQTHSSTDTILFHYT